MSIQWIDYVWREPHPADPVELEKLEATWGVKLPEEYKQIACKYHGMAPLPDVFDLEWGDNVFCNLLTLTSGEHERDYAISTIHEVIKPYVPPEILPFGITSGGEYLCFDYRDAPEQPRIVLVTTEMYIYPVADSFREFMEGLHELRE